MGRHANLPFHLYVNVSNEALGPAMPKGHTRAIWHAVYCRPGQNIMAHCLLESGAHWCGVPLHLISTTEQVTDPFHTTEPWGAMGDHIETFHAHYLEGMPVVTLHEQAKGRHTGIIIDWSDGFSRYPQEHKPLNLLNLCTGQFALLPNNYLLMNDKHFTRNDTKQNLKFYKRNETVYWEQ